MSKPHIHFTIPYSFEKKLFEAYDFEMQKVADPEDWVAFTDGDILFFPANFGHIIQSHINKHPETGMFTCYTNRIKNDIQLLSRKAWDIDSLKHHFNVAKSMQQNAAGQSYTVKGKLGGMLMVMKKAVWEEVKEDIREKTQNMKLLSVDNAICDVLMQHNYTMRIMEDMYVLHYRRFNESKQERGME